MWGSFCANMPAVGFSKPAPKKLQAKLQTTTTQQLHPYFTGTFPPIPASQPKSPMHHPTITIVLLSPLAQTVHHTPLTFAASAPTSSSLPLFSFHLKTQGLASHVTPPHSRSVSRFPLNPFLNSLALHAFFVGGCTLVTRSTPPATPTS